MVGKAGDFKVIVLVYSLLPLFDSRLICKTDPNGNENRIASDLTELLIIHRRSSADLLRFEKPHLVFYLTIIFIMFEQQKEQLYANPFRIDLRCFPHPQSPCYFWE